MMVDKIYEENFVDGRRMQSTMDTKPAKRPDTIVVAIIRLKTDGDKQKSMDGGDEMSFSTLVKSLLVSFNDFTLYSSSMSSAVIG